MKKQNKNLPMPSKWRKRTAAVATAAMMLLSSTPISPLYETFSGWISNFSITAKAAEEDWVIDSHIYPINSASDLSKYSVAYHLGLTDHTHDTLEINFTGETASLSDYEISPFYSIGETNAGDMPFRGTITINDNSLNYINIDKAFFAQIGEEAVIKADSTGSNALIISRSATSTDPIFAKKVVAAASGATTSGATLGWNINTKTYLDNGNVVNSNVDSLIGEIEDNCTVKVSFTDERCMNVVSTESAGYICGKLGDSATLEIGNVTSSGVTVSTSGSGKHAGAIVGEMGNGATLKLPYDMASFPVSTVAASNGYAGGIVGSNNGGEIAFTGTKGETKYTVNQEINGKIGSGGIYGYYCPALTNSAAALSYDDINVACTLKGAGGSGGLFGLLYNNNGSITLSDATGDTDHITVNNAGATTNYGGLIGSYSAASLDDTLTISSGCTSKPSQDGGSSSAYGGAIGAVVGKAYVRANSFNTTSSNTNNYGGIVGSATEAFIDVNATTITISSFASSAAPNCGGFVYDLGNGVLRLDGTTDLTNAATTGGQIVKKRNAGFVFAESAWTLKRSGAAADDIGDWGEVVRFGTNLAKADVVTHSDGDHYVTLLPSVTSMSSAAEFAKTALNIQHNTGAITDSAAVLRFTSSSGTANTLLGTSSTNGTNLSLSGSFSLSGTGIQGLTRDDGSQAYKEATFNGNGYTLTLAIGENYGLNGTATVAADATGSGKIYKHSNIGLFGKTNGATIQDVSLAGNIYVSSAATQYVGAAAAENAGGFTAYGVTVSTAMHHSGSSQLCMGGLLGRSTSGDYTIGGTGTNACTLTMNIMGTNSADSTCIGGAIGLVDTAAFTGAINNVTVSGTIACGSKTDGSSGRKIRQQLGGLIGYIEKSTTSGRSLSVDAVTVSGLTLQGIVGQGNGTDKGALSMGGLLGYGWFDTDVALNSITISGTPTINVYVDNLNGINVDTAGLVYAGTGSWTVGTVSIPSISVNTYTKGTDTKTANIRSCGMIVNRGWHESAALYLVLPDMTTYTLGTSSAALSQVTNFSSFNSTTVFDELVAYSAIYEEDSTGARTSKILENGQGIVSIRTRGNTATVNNVMKTNTCNTYQNQVVAGTNGSLNMGNPNTRYYYDLDLLLAKSSASLTSSDKLMLWSLHQYAHESLTGTGKPFSSNPFSNNAIAPTGSQTFDMDGYSYYPVDVSGATIKGTFKLYNQTIEYGEDGKTATGIASAFTPTDDYARTTLNESGSAFTDTPYTQHHLMQNGIFLNAKGAIVVNGVLTLQGTIGADTYSDTGSGALICGTLQGYLNTDGTPANASLTCSDINTLDGEGNITSTTDCEIVLDGIKVHNIGSRTSTIYAPLLVNRIDSYTNLTLEDVYVKNSSSYGTSGAVAASSLIGDAGTSTESCNINLTFSKIKLDGRSESIPSGDNALTTAYGTSLSIFTKATLLNKYQYYTGSSGKYNYMLSEDWGADGNGNRFVTYGREVGYDNSTVNSEWGNKEQRYLAEAGSTDNPFYTHPDEKPTASSTKYGSFGKFLPYVATAYDGNTKHELKVNHGKTNISGCGTYNDPYLITDGQQLADIATIISGDHTDAKVCMPKNSADFTAKWDSGGHQIYNYNNNNNYVGADNNVSVSKGSVIQYLCSAYYKINEDIELPSAFIGLGSTGTQNQAFRGVIVGNNNPTITNKSPNPLILNSNGSVVKDVTIKVENSGITTVDVANASTVFGVNSNLEAYGAVIGKIHGGDNIIDNVGVTFDTGTAITVASKRTPVGGYVGVEIAGALIFRNMSTNKNGLTTTQCSYVTDDNYLYVNPIIGRVINAYAVTEATAYHPFEDMTRDGYTSGNAVTMKNGTKNYSITDIVKETTTNGVTTPYSMLQIGAYSAVTNATDTTNKTTITFPNAQSVFILSCLIQDGVTANSTDSYSYGYTNIKSYNDNYKTTHVSHYRGIGLTKKNDAGEDVIITSKDEYGTVGTINPYAKADYDLALTDSYAVVGRGSASPTINTTIPYLAANYVDFTNRNGIFRLTNTATVCDIGFSGTAGTWYLPDGFRGLGTIGFGITSNNSTTQTQVKNMTLSVNKLSGLIGSNVVNLDLNMNLKHYNTGFDNYLPANTNTAGFGLFNTIRHNRTDQTPSNAVKTTLDERTDDNYKIKYLDISGKVYYDVLPNTGTIAYTNANVYKNNYLHVGGLTGYTGFESSENLNIENIGLSGLTVNGFKTTGGLVGYMKMASAADYLATVSSINTNGFEIVGKDYVGGLIASCEGTNIEVDNITISAAKILTEFNGTSQSSHDFKNATGGIIGYVSNTASNLPAIVSNVVIGDKNASSSSRIGIKDGITMVNNPSGTVTGGIIGHSATNKNSNYEYSIEINNCYLYNMDVYGHKVAGILAQNTGAEYLKIFDCHAISNKGSSINGVAVDQKNRGCGGIAGYLRTPNKVLFENCSVEGYTISANKDSAGLCANIGDSGNVYFNNIKLKDLVIASPYSGGFIAWTGKNVYGYNLLSENLLFKGYNTNGKPKTMCGYFIGKIGNSREVKIAAFSRHNPTSVANEYYIPDNMIDAYNNDTPHDTNNYGGGYVIFADYNGTSSSEKKNDWSVYDYNDYENSDGSVVEVSKNKTNEYNTFSSVYKTVTVDGEETSPNVAINSQDSVDVNKTLLDNEVRKFIKDKDGNVIKGKVYYPIVQNFPFVTSSPFVNIGINSIGIDANGNSRNHMQFLTGDGVSHLRYEYSAANAILDHLQLTDKPKNYYNQVSLADQTVNGATVSGAKYLDDLLAEKYTTFQTIMSTQYPADLRTLGIDFPVLIVDNTNGSYLNTFLNGYLQTLTNTNYTFSANNQSSIYNLRIAKCEYDSENKKFEVTYKNSLSDTSATDGVSLYTRNGNFIFDINTVDSGKVQFTLIDVEFYNPGTTEVAYHLYVPLYVSQMLKFDFQVSSKSGSNYKLSEYTSDRGNSTLENAGTPITIEARYVYQRDLSEWKQAAENGENLLRSIPKTWDISDQATHHGFPADTKMVLIDPNNGNKAYYSSVTGGQVYGTGTGVVTDQTELGGVVSKLYLNKFVDLSGNNTFTSTQLNDYFDITLATSNATDGKFVPCADQTNHPDATICGKSGSTTVWLKPKTDETSGTFYNISLMAYKSTAPTVVNGSKTYLKEDYYVTIFTANDGNLYHWNVVAPDNLGESQYPSLYSRLDNQKTKQSTQIVTGDLFVITDNALTTVIHEGSNGSYAPKNANDVDIASRITVDVTNKIGMTEQMFANKSFLGNSSVHIYQTFLLSMNKQTGIDESSRGIEAKPAVEMHEYTVGAYDVLTDTSNSYYTRYQSTTPRYDSNYIYLENGKDLRQMLYNSNSGVSEYANAQGVTIHANLYLTYSNTGDITNQYPQREEAQLNDNTIGTWIGCNSSIASTEAAAIASKTTEYIAEPTSSRNLYYSRSSSTASLLYSSDDFDGKYSGGNLYDQLGINAKDLPATVTGNMCPMNTVVVYDVSKLMSIIDDSAGVELTFRLVRKDANGKYTQDLDIADYLTDPTFKTLAVTKDTTNSNSKIYTYRFAKANLAGVYNGGVYTIPIDFKVKTNFSGTDLTDHYYSNYKVIVSASLYEMKNVEVDGQTTQKPVQMSGTTADDHIIYTNAKIDESVFD